MDMTITEVSAVTGYKPESLRALAKQHRLPGAYKLGGHWRINRERFERHRDGVVIVNTSEPDRKRNTNDLRGDS